MYLKQNADGTVIQSGSIFVTDTETITGFDRLSREDMEKHGFYPADESESLPYNPDTHIKKMGVWRFDTDKKKFKRLEFLEEKSLAEIKTEKKRKISEECWLRIREYYTDDADMQFDLALIAEANDKKTDGIALTEEEKSNAARIKKKMECCQGFENKLRYAKGIC